MNKAEKGYQVHLWKSKTNNSMITAHAAFGIAGIKFRVADLPGYEERTHRMYDLTWWSEE